MTDLHIETAGDTGPCVLLVQGTGVAGCGWAPQVDGLRDGFRLAWFDNRGVGSSPGRPTSLEAMAEDAEAVLDHLGWSEAHVCGHSLGGVIAQALAVRAPSRVRSLALLCSFLRGRTAMPSTAAQLWLQTRTAIGTRTMRRRAFFEMVTDPTLPVDDAHIEALEAVFGRRLDALPKVAMKQVRILAGSDLTAALTPLEIPTLAVSAEHDRVAPPDQGRALADVLRGRFVEVPGGHAVTVQDAPRINALLREFWTSCDD